MRTGLGVLAAVLSIPPAFAQDHAVGGRIGLLGIGAEYTYRLSDRISFRAGLNGSSYSFDATESGIEYGFDLDFDSLAIGVDVHPFDGPFRVSAGLLKNDSGLSAHARAGQDFTIGDTTYSADEVGSLRGRIGFDSTAPMLGIGWEWLREKKVGVAFDLGLVKQGSPVVTLGADGPIASDPDFQDSLAAEEAELRRELDDLDLYPYAMLGVLFRF